MSWNSVALCRVFNHWPFDLFPYILLKLVLSFAAGIENPIILMAQNRQAQRDRLRAQADHQGTRQLLERVAGLHQTLGAPEEEAP